MGCPFDAQAVGRFHRVRPAEVARDRGRSVDDRVTTGQQFRQACCDVRREQITLGHLNLLPQGQAERYKRTEAMVETMEQFFGSCTNHGECEEACPKDAIFMSDELELANSSRMELLMW